MFDKKKYMEERGWNKRASGSNKRLVFNSYEVNIKLWIDNDSARQAMYLWNDI